MKGLEGQWRWTLVCLAFVLGMAAISCCIAAECKKAKLKDMKVDGKLCSLARTPAFGFGIAASACLFVTQIIGTSIIGTSWSSLRAKSVIFLLSWISFGLAAVLLATGSSMNNWQHYGKGWMDGTCYVVKTGIFTCSAVLIVSILSLMLGVMITMRRPLLNHSSTEDELKMEHDHKQSECIVH